MSDLAETVKRLRGLADKAIAESHTIHFGNNAHNAFRDACQPELIAGILEAHADALERLERELAAWGANRDRYIQDLHNEQKRAEELEAQLAAVTTERRAPGCYGLDTPERVRFYEHDFYVLSNFSAFSVAWAGLTFATAEAAYHWEKFRSEDGQKIRNRIFNAKSAHDAFKIAQENRVDSRIDWDAVKVDIMRDILRAKAAEHEYVRRKLLATGDRELVEDSWRDAFWGWGPNQDGKNMLGKLWMEVRAELRAQHPTPSQGTTPEKEGE